jgi:hypothetical protein
MFRLLGDDQIKMKHMKDLKKALRIHYAKVKLTKRINNWFNTRWGSNLEMKEQAYRGEICTFLRTTGNPCNCYMCSGSNKFVREQKQYVVKKIKSDLEE